MEQVGFPGGSALKSHLQCRRHRLDPGVGKIPWKKIATHSSILPWEIPWTEEPGWLQSLWSLNVNGRNAPVERQSGSLNNKTRAYNMLFTRPL